MAPSAGRLPLQELYFSTHFCIFIVPDYALFCFLFTNSHECDIQLMWWYDPARCTQYITPSNVLISVSDSLFSVSDSLISIVLSLRAPLQLLTHPVALSPMAIIPRLRYSHWRIRLRSLPWQLFHGSGTALTHPVALSLMVIIPKGYGTVANQTKAQIPRECCAE